MKNILVTLLILAVVGGGLAWTGWSWYQRFLAEPLTLDADQAILVVPPGSTLRSVAHELADRRWISSRFLFMMLAYQTKQQNAIKAGEYAIENGTRPPGLLALLASGRSIQFPVTLVPGTTFHEALKTIADVGVFQRELAGLSDQQIATRIGIDGEHSEGWLFPDTYHFGRGTADIEILKRAHRRMQQVLAEEWDQRSDALPLSTPYEALIMASIVEKETGLAAERPQIAAVFLHRLEKGMKLQTDPTVIYGLGDSFDGNLRRGDLEAPTPYNTYVNKGLPPTPIALPGREAIHAVLHPAATQALYFVARGDGSHHFSATLDEHNCAVRYYQLKRPCARYRLAAVKEAATTPEDHGGAAAGATAAESKSQ